MAIDAAIQQDRQIEVLSTEATALEQQANALQVVDNATLTGATDMLGRIAGLKKAIEARRTALVKPLNDHVKSINAWLRGVAAPVEAADQTVRGKVLAYQQEQERIRRAEEERLRKLAEKEQARLERKAEKKGEAPPPPMPMPTLEGPAKTVQAAGGSATMRTEWDFEITDEAQVPREYLMVDESKIRRVVRAGIRNIPGVRVYERQTLAVRGR